MKVLFWSPIPFARRDVLEAVGEVEGIDMEMVESLDECVKAVAEADVIVAGDAPVAEARRIVEAISSPESRVRAFHFISAGREGFEHAGLPESLAVSGPVGAAAPTVAEHALALTLALGRQMPVIVRDNMEENWNRSLVRNLRSLEGQNVLIVGLGHIGREVAARMKSFGAYTIGLQRRPRQDDSVDELGTIADIDSFLPRADVIVLTAALSDETRHIINRERLGLCRPSALVVNVARGGLIDSDALAEALGTGIIGGAGLDVTEPEPLPRGHVLWSAPNIILSSHLAGGGSPAAMRRVGQSAAALVRSLLAGSRVSPGLVSSAQTGVAK